MVSVASPSISEIEFMKTLIYDKEDKEKLLCYGYKKCKLLSHMTFIFSVCLGGIPFVLFHWKPQWKLKFMHVPSCFETSTVVKLEDLAENIYVLDLHHLFLDSHSNLIHMLFPQFDTSHFNGTTENIETTNLYYSFDSSVETNHNKRSKEDNVRIVYFDFRFVRYYWNPYENSFVKLDGIDNSMRCDALVQMYSHGLTSQEEHDRSLLYGSNEIPIQVKSYFCLLVEEVLSPFYIFQVFSVTLWLLDKYYYYATCIILISIASICISLYETKKQSQSIYNMVTRGASSNISILTKNQCEPSLPAEPGGDTFHEDIYLQMSKTLKTVHATDLVPGDVLVIPSSGFNMPCDAVLLSGSCIVNESVLTGESVPIIKNSISNQGCDDEIYDSLVHKKHTLYAGTHIMQAKASPAIKNYQKREEQEKITALAIVVKTGFSTTKGKLIKSILHPKPLGFEFYKDSMRFVCVLAGLACLGMLYSAYILFTRKTPIYRIILRTLDIVTIVVPPSLPAAMTVGTVYSQSRLKKNNIFCISPPRINVCGKIDLACFDKTGTLTEEGLDFWGIVPNDPTFKRFDTFITDPPIDLPRDSMVLYCLASCHSLTLIDGDICGDPLELKMFQATTWILEEPTPDLSQNSSLLPTIVKPPTKEWLVKNSFQDPDQILKIHSKARQTNENSNNSTFTHIDQPPNDENPIEIGIIRHFSFSSTLQTMSVMVRILGENHFTLFTKGAPEKLIALCDPVSVPPNHNEVLRAYTLKGFRVVSLAYKSLDKKLTWHHAQKIKREVLERDLTFLGFLIMKNALKPATSHVIYELITANIRPLMVTGDNMLTAISVAHECGLIPFDERVIAVKTMASSEDDCFDQDLIVGQKEEQKPEVMFELIETVEPDKDDQSNHSGVELVGHGRGLSITDQQLFRFWDGTVVAKKAHYSSHYDNFRARGPMGGLSEDEHTHVHRTNSAPSAIYQTDEVGGDLRIVRALETKSRTPCVSKSEECDEYKQLISPVYLEKGSKIFRKNYHFTLTGETFSSLHKHYPKLLSKILLRGSVFARMAPDQKTQLIESYQTLGYVVSMCGDGANDCGALKAAHAGISLSDAEASVASPFTSKTQNISCIIRVIREGRCSLVTSFGIFKFMALYSMIQFISVLILYTLGTNMADRQFLYIDLGIITTLAIFMGRTGPYKSLDKERPISGLMTFPNLISIFTQILLQVVFQVAALLFLKRQRWYHPPPFPESNSAEVKLCWEVTIIFWISTFQYLIMAIAFSYDKPFRQSIASNRLFLLSILSIVSFNILLVIFPSSMLEQFFTLMPAGKNPHFAFRSIVLSIIALNFISSIFLEKVITYFSKRSRKFRDCWKTESLPHVKLQKQLNHDSNWPPRFQIHNNLSR